jgi:hypothetical protein
MMGAKEADNLPNLKASLVQHHRGIITGNPPRSAANG